MESEPVALHMSIQEEADVTLVEEAIENFSTLEPPVAEMASVVSELPTEIPEEPQIENDQAEDLALPTNDLAQEEAVVPNTEVKETVESSSINEPSVADTLLVGSVPPEEPQTEKDSIAKTEEDSAVPPLSTVDPIQEEDDVSLVEFKEAVENPSTAQPSVAEITPLVSELPTEVPKELQIENDSIAQAEDLAPLTDDLAQEEVVVPIAEVKETVESSSTEEPSVADSLLVNSEPATVPEEPQIENDNIAKTEEDLAVPPLPTVDPVQEEADISLVELEEAVENSSTPQPPVAEIAPVVSELPTEVPKEPQIENDVIAQAEDLAPPTDTFAQEEAVVPNTEVKETVESSSTEEPSVADTLLVSSEPATVAPEEPQTENDNIPQAEEDLVVPPLPTINPVMEEADVSLVEFEEEVVENHSTAQPPAAEIAPVVSELPTEVPKELQIENDSIAQAEDLAPLTDDLAQEEAIVPIAEVKETESSSTEEPSLADKTTVVPKEPQAENDSIAKTEEDLAVPLLSTVDSEPVQEADVSLVEFEEAVENSSTAQPPAAEIAPVVSELPTEVPKELQIENDSIAQAEDLAPLTDDLAQEEAIVPVAEVKETESSSTEEPSLADKTTVVPEEPQTENDSIAKTEEDLAVPPLSTVGSEPVQEADVSLVEFEEAVENSSTAQPPVAEIAPVVSELPTEVPEELQIENDSIAQAEDSAPLTDDLAQEEVVVPIAEVKETVESFSTEEPSVADTPLVSSEPATVVPEEPQTENDSVAKPEEDLAVPPLPTVDPVQEEADVNLVEVEEAVENPSTAQPPVAEIAPVVFELPTEVPQVDSENVNVAQAEDLAPPTDTLAQEETVVPVVEAKETVNSSIGEPSSADALLVSSEPATVVLEEPQIENDSIAQAEEDFVDPPPDTLLVSSEPAIAVPEETPADEDVIDPPTSEPAIVPEELQTENDSIVQAKEDLIDPPPLIDDPVQEEASATRAKFEEAIENSSADQPPVAEMAPVVSELPTEVPEELQIENDSIVQAENLAPSSDNLAQEEVMGPIAEFKAVESSSADEPSVADTPLAIISEPATVEQEAVQIENGGIPHAEESLVDPPPTDEPVQKGANATPVEFEEAVENSSTAQPPVSEIAPVVSELPTEVPEELQISGAQTEEVLVDPSPTDDPVQEKAIESFSTAEPPVAETVSVVSEPPTELHWEFSLISDRVAPADDGLSDPPPLQNVETTAVDDLVVDQAALGKVEMQSFDETETHVLNGNGHSTQETIGTHGMFLNPYITFDHITNRFRS